MRLVLDKRQKTVIIVSVLVILAVISTIILLTGMNRSKETAVSDDPIDIDPGDTVVYNPEEKEDNTEKDEDNRPEENMVVEEEKLVTDGKKLATGLVEEGTINVLFLGEDVGNSLMDTIGIASIDKKEKKIKVIMIPRDTYIQYSDYVLEHMEQQNMVNLPGAFKINYSYWLGYTLKHEGKFDSKGINFVADVIKEKFDIEIDDYVKVNTKGFVQIVDLFGGVDIYVPYDKNYEDPSQDLYIHLEEGYQHLNGEQAEGFVRYRQGTDRYGVFHDYGDVERKRNQITFLKEFFRQHATLGNVDKIPEFIRILGNNVWSSIKVSDVLFKYMGILKDVIVDKYEIESVVLAGSGYKTIKGASYVIFEEQTSK